MLRKIIVCFMYINETSCLLWWDDAIFNSGAFWLIWCFVTDVFNVVIMFVFRSMWPCSVSARTLAVRKESRWEHFNISPYISCVSDLRPFILQFSHQGRIGSLEPNALRVCIRFYHYYLPSHIHISSTVHLGHLTSGIFDTTKEIFFGRLLSFI